MEQNEQTQESTEVTESTGAPATEVASDTVEAKKDEITEQTALVKIEGQEFELEASLAQDDKTIKMVLQPHFSSVENANITREVKDGKLTVTIVKKAQHKGTETSPLEILRSEAEQINPAILLADELMRKDASELLSTEDIELAQTVVTYGRHEIENVQRQLAALISTPASSSAYIPVGF